ncbi:hypothetical protein PMZ80_003240 [Knufia obscura]|uniref:Uncharacterized protein n=2 Tax=Knufia TaxID=430999 RepID=A0AAN8I1Z9_9EURO|nr:hypothetical protein PMZ80_003240 [Knufia obscura]KAK5950357.1 hypothetical protein OHC33_008576 [Knufia fluminis]
MSEPPKGPYSPDNEQSTPVLRRRGAGERRNSPAARGNRSHPYSPASRTASPRRESAIFAEPTPGGYFKKPAQKDLQPARTTPHLAQARMKCQPTPEVAANGAMTDNTTAVAGSTASFPSRPNPDVPIEDLSIRAPLDQILSTVQAKDDEIRRLKARLRDMEKLTDPRRLTYMSDIDKHKMEDNVARANARIADLQRDLKERDYELKRAQTDLEKERKLAARREAYIVKLETISMHGKQ